MAAVLGISGLYHDAAAALVVDGKIVCAVAEERLTRVKHDAQLPLNAARAVLAFGKLNAQDLDAVVFYENPFSKLEKVLTRSLARAPFGLMNFPRAMASQLGSKIWVLDVLAQSLGVERKKVTHSEHHLSHAASAFYTSPFEQAAVLTIDGVGEDTCSALWLGNKNELTCLKRQRFPHSLGLLYAAITAYLGFEVNDGEYKVMGLASFGKPKFRPEFEKFAQLKTDGSLHLVPKFFAHFENETLGFGPDLEKLIGPRRPFRKPFDFSNEESLRAADIAATLQLLTEESMLAMARVAFESTGSENLCLAGGVALNCVANARLTRASQFKNIYVHSASTDAGGALGCAISHAISLGDSRPTALEGASLGLDVDMNSLCELALQMKIPFIKVSDPVESIHNLLTENKVVALVQGRFEWGPRALGNRSILALPFEQDTKERVNRVIKKREPFRPFAPAVLTGEFERYFEGQPDLMTPLMCTTRNVLDSQKNRLLAVTHIDGTSRVQSVKNDGNFFGALLSRVGKSCGISMLLNTSLNGSGEPIVGGAEDALAFFLSHPVDAMLVEDVLFERRS